MRCDCGYEVLGNHKTCPACGKDIDSVFSDDDAKSKNKSSNIPNAPAMLEFSVNPQSKYCDLGGFLLVLVVVIILNAIFFLINQLAVLPGNIVMVKQLFELGLGYSGLFGILFVIASWLQTAGEVVFVILIFKKSSHAIKAFILSGFFGAIGLIANMQTMRYLGATADEINALVAMTIVSFVFLVAIVAAILVYWHKSVRVHNYMKKDTTIDVDIK